MNVNLQDCRFPQPTASPAHADRPADITDGAECFEINLTRPSKDGAPEPVFSESFNPTFTHQLFGEEQQILGYKDPTIQLNFRANDMRPSLQAGYEAMVELPEGTYSDQHRKVDFKNIFGEAFPAWTGTSIYPCSPA